MENQTDDTQTLPKFLVIVLKHCHVTGPYEYEFIEENILLVDAETIFEAYSLVSEMVKSWNRTYKNAYDLDVVCTVKDILMNDTFDYKKQKIGVISVRDFRDYDSYKNNYKN